MRRFALCFVVLLAGCASSAVKVPQPDPGTPLATEEFLHFVSFGGYDSSEKVRSGGQRAVAVGPKRPGLLLRRSGARPSPTPLRTRLRLEVPDARSAAEGLAAAGLAAFGPPFRVATGWTVEVADPWGNVVGLTDYSTKPDLARPRRNA